jgi:hypothetical protein
MAKCWGLLVASPLGANLKRNPTPEIENAY